MFGKKTKIVGDRWEFIEKYVQDKAVLDVGCAELVATTDDCSKKERWISERIMKSARDVTCLEINKEQVARLQELGYKVVLGDTEKINLSQTFDVIFAGELIEHLSNPGMFFDNMASHLNKNGLLIITTPNRFYLLDFLKAFIRNKIPQYTKKIASHVFYFDINSLYALAERHKFQLVDSSYYWTFGKSYDSFKRRFILKIMAKIRPQFTLGMVAVFKRNQDEI
ncbi:MAG: class I SAM-dependent methyltransferase [Candidatus Nealsonbacteria bacterium]